MKITKLNNEYCIQFNLDKTYYGYGDTKLAAIKALWQRINKLL